MELTNSPTRVPLSFAPKELEGSGTWLLRELDAESLERAKVHKMLKDHGGATAPVAVDAAGTLFELAGHEQFLNSVCYNSDGNMILTASSDKTARVWDASNGDVLAVLAGHEGPVWSAAFSAHGHRIVTGSADRTARVLALARATEIRIPHAETSLLRYVVSTGSMVMMP